MQKTQTYILIQKNIQKYYKSTKNTIHKIHKNAQPILPKYTNIQKYNNLFNCIFQYITKIRQNTKITKNYIKK